MATMTEEATIDISRDQTEQIQYGESLQEVVSSF
jgi:hypothetical protein